MTYSFYGGRQGKNFEITQVFKNREELEADLSLGYHSQVGVGNLVYISYGLPNKYIDDTNASTVYEENSKIDLDKYGKTYNSTIWEKIYGKETKEIQNGNEEYDNSVALTSDSDMYQINNEVTGFGYRLIGSLTGNTPIFDIGLLDNELGPRDVPEVDIDSTEIDRPKLNFNFPRTPYFFYGNGTSFGYLNKFTAGSYTYTIQELQKIDNSNLFDNDKNCLIKIGDSYIDQKSGNIYLLTGIEDDKYTFTYEARIAPDIMTNGLSVPLNPYINVEGDWIAQFPWMETDYQDRTEKLGWNLIPYLPKVPKFEFVSYQEADTKEEQGNEQELFSKVEYVPLENNNRESDTLKVSLYLPKGDTGDSVAIKQKHILESINSSPTIEEYINSNLSEWFKMDTKFRDGGHVHNIHWINDVWDENTESYTRMFEKDYWVTGNGYNGTIPQYILMQLTGNSAGLITNSESISTSQAYSANYINNLIANIKTTWTSFDPQ